MVAGENQSRVDESCMKNRWQQSRYRGVTRACQSRSQFSLEGTLDFGTRDLRQFEESALEYRK